MRRIIKQAKDLTMRMHNRGVREGIEAWTRASLEQVWRLLAGPNALKKRRKRRNV